MIFPGGWNDLAISQPRRIKPILASVQIFDGGATYSGQIVNSSDYFTPSGAGWIASPFSLASEPVVVSINSLAFPNELYQANAMNQQTLMANLTDAPPPLANFMYLYGNTNGKLDFQMNVEINFGAGNYPWVELSIMDNAATDGGPNGVVEAYRVENAGNFTGLNTLYLMFDNFVGPVNLGLRAESTLNVSSIFELRCIVMDANQR